jgi:hypothetical protein
MECNQKKLANREDRYPRDRRGGKRRSMYHNGRLCGGCADALDNAQHHHHVQCNPYSWVPLLYLPGQRSKDLNLQKKAKAKMPSVTKSVLPVVERTGLRQGRLELSSVY